TLPFTGAAADFGLAAGGAVLGFADSGSGAAIPGASNFGCWPLPCVGAGCWAAIGKAVKRPAKSANLHMDFLSITVYPRPPRLAIRFADPPEQLPHASFPSKGHR